MAKFNTASPTPTRTVNLAGGEAYQEPAKLELVSLLLTSFLSNQFYKKAEDQTKRLEELVGQVDPLFAAKAAIYARNEFGMRSVTHVVAGEVAHKVRGEKWTAAFFDKVVHRPDDMLEIAAYYLSKYAGVKAGKRRPLPNSLKRGLARAFGRFDTYQLAKYRGEEKDVKLVDLVNLIHPKPTDKNREALAALVKGELKSTDTWEVRLTQAGQTAKTAEQKAELKEEAWKQLLSERKIGYFALLRNLRNILEQAPEMVGTACELLTEERLIHKSLVMPFRFVTAVEELEKVPGAGAYGPALAKATDIAVANCPELPGKTLVALDVSGSMAGKTAQIASLFAAVILKRNATADLVRFHDRAEYHNVLKSDSVLSIAKSIRGSDNGTNFHAIFKAIGTRPYDQIVILSDMQGWMGYNAPTKDLTAYRLLTGVKTKVFSFDMAGYGTLQFPESDVYAIAGFSEKVFDLMATLMEDRQTLIHKIESVEL